MLVADAEVEIRRPERVLIRGQSGSGKSTIMRAVAGVWPWGRGAIHLPTRQHHLHAAEALLPARHPARCLALSQGARGRHRRSAEGDAAQGRPRPPARPARRDRTLGPHPVRRRAAAGRLRPHPDPQARLDLHGRGDLGARRGGPGERHEAPDRGTAGDIDGQHRPPAGARSLPYPRADPGPGRGGRQAGGAAGHQGPRALRDVYRGMSAASRAQRRIPASGRPSRPTSAAGAGKN